MKGQTNHVVQAHKLQRSLRNNATDAERTLWQRLRGRQMDGCKFRRQHPFGDFILDFACLQRMVVVELDGGQHAQAIEADAARTALLERAGFQVLRFWNNQVFEEIDAVLEVIWRALCARGEHHPHPSPPLEGEGVENHPHPSPPLEGEGVENHPHPSPPFEGHAVTGSNGGCS